MMLEKLESSLESYRREPPDGETWLSALVLAVEEINASDDPSWIAKAVERLRDAASKVASEVDAVTFSITAGLPRGVSVTLEWAVDR